MFKFLKRLFVEFKKLFKRKRYFRLTFKEWHKISVKREIIEEPNPYIGDSILGDAIKFLETSKGGKLVSRIFSKLMPILGRI